MVMIRPKGKATRIAYNLIGKPSNIKPQTARERYIERMINSKQFSRVNT